MTSLEKSLAAGAAQLMTIWQEFSVDGNLPHRRDFTLSRLGRFASCFMALKLTEDDALVVTQSGTAIDYMWGRNIVGGHSQSLVLSDEANLSDEFALAALAHPCGVHVGRSLEKASGNKLAHETLYLPVVSEFGLQLVSITDFSDRRLMHGLLGDTSEIVGGILHFANHVDLGFGRPEGLAERVA